MADVEKPQFFYCESCGIWMKTVDDRGGKNANNSWCRNCCDESGRHKSMEEVKKTIIAMISGPDMIRAVGEKVADPEEISRMADDYLKRMPAWKPEEAE